MTRVLGAVVAVAMLTGCGGPDDSAFDAGVDVDAFGVRARQGDLCDETAAHVTLCDLEADTLILACYQRQNGRGAEWFVAFDCATTGQVCARLDGSARESAVR